MGYVRCPQLSPNQSSKWRKIPFSIEAIPCFHVLPLQTLLGLLFLFLPVLCLSALPPPVRMWVAFRSSGFPAAPSIRPQLAHTAPIGPVWGFSGVHSLPGPQIRTQALTRPFSLCPYLLYFSPTGKSWVDLAPVLPIPPRSAHNCPTRLQQGGEPVLQVLLPYPAPKTAHRATQARVWISPSFSPWLSHRHPS